MLFEVVMMLTTEAQLETANIANPKIAMGYKTTEFGLIPEDWSVCQLKDLIKDLEAGVSVNSVEESLHLRTHSFSILKTSAVSNGAFFSRKCKKIHPKDISRAKLNPRAEAIIISRMNTPDLVGECCYVQEDHPHLFLPDRLWMTNFHKGIDVNAQWLNFLLNSVRFKKKIKASATGTSGSMKNISKEVLLGILIPYPNSNEQKKIAAALSDIDSLINSLDQLIAKKRNIKLAAMQQLLTGKQRFPGFSGKWEMKRLRKLLKFQVGFPFRSALFNQKGEGLRLIKNRDLKNDDQVVYYCGEYDKDYLVTNNDVLIGMDGDFTPCFWQKGKALLNQRVGRILVSSDLSKLFIYYSLIKKLKEIESVTSGTTVKHLSHGIIEKIELAIPSFKEQSIIANALYDMDTELSSLEQQLAKAQNLKQGMMQELLTGRIRLT